MWLGETNALANRMALIKHFEMRYKLTLLLGSQVRSFMANIKRGQVTFNAYLTALQARIEMTARCHQNTRKLSFVEQLTYDYDEIVIADSGANAGSRVVTLNHGILIVRRYRSIHP